MLPLPLPIKRYSVNPFAGSGKPYALLSLASASQAEEQVWHLQEMLFSISDAFPILTSVSERMQLQTFVQATMMYDMSVATHEQRIVPLVTATARLLQLSEEETHLICLAAFLHDLGKICLPYRVVQKAGPLNEQEWYLIRQHPALGAALLTFAGSTFATLAPIVIAHHEHWDGGGYPHGLAGKDIPLGARLISVIDSYDAMTVARPYSTPQSHEQACAELLRCAGTYYDPLIVAAFLASFVNGSKPA
jgi:response regulator RpfG family c-di-GMP phosphodiesterase